MGKGYTIGVNQIVCVAVLIPTEKLGLPNPKDIKMDTPLSEDGRAKVTELIDISKQYGGVGSTIVEMRYFAILIDVQKWKENGKPFFDLCAQKGYEPKVAQRTVIIDKRYGEGGQYEGFVVEIPPQYIDDAIRGFIQGYCDELKVTQDVQKGLLIFEGELYPDIKLSIMYNDHFFGGGISNSVVYVTQFPTRDYKRILKDIQNTVEKWIEDHKGVFNNKA